MVAPKGFGRSFGSVPLPSFTSYAFSSARSPRESTTTDDPADHDNRGFGERSCRDYEGGVGDLDGIFASVPFSKSASAHDPSFDYDSMFDSFKDPVPPKVTLASCPGFDRPLHDKEDIFDGIPGLKTSPTVNSDDVFALLPSFSCNHCTRTADDDLLGELSGKEHIVSNSGRKQSRDAEQVLLGFDDLIPGFGVGSSQKREYADTNHQKSSQPNKAASVSMDPFSDLESTSVSGYPSSGLFVDPVDNIGTSSGIAKFDAFNGVFDDVNAFSGINKSTLFFPSAERSTKTSDHVNLARLTAVKESIEKAFVKSSDDEPKKEPGETYRKAEQTCINIPTTNSDFDQFKTNRKQHPQENEDVWLTVSEIPLFTQPTSASPPSKSPPFSRKERQFAPMNKSELANVNARSKGNASVPLSHPKKNYTPSSIDKLEDFAMGKPQIYAGKQAGAVSSEKDSETGSAAATSAAAMKDAVDRAEAKMKQAWELRERERESRTTKNTEFVHQPKKDKIALYFQNAETGENFKNFHLEKELRENEDKEKERRRLERDREKELVEKAWEKAAVVARQKAERATFQKANAEARVCVARAAVNKTTSEALGRAAAQARDRAAAQARERAAREAMERENTEREVREKAAAMAWESQRAAAQRAVIDAQQRAEWAAVKKVNREAHEGATATASARERQYNNENDLDSVFRTSVWATSEQRHRRMTLDFSFDAPVPNKGGSIGGKQASSSLSSSGTRKTSSANFLDGLTFVFGGFSLSREFQEIDGESKERRRAWLERDQRALERAVKALAEKKERDMQVQREQAERDRIAERLEVEIKRWAAGKEGNLRALLSTLQYVLWPDCGWQAVSLTDLITAASVKKVYRKATLHLHPDKVQQKGANLEQKIIAEKVFDLLKEAWNKFNSEVLF